MSKIKRAIEVWGYVNGDSFTDPEPYILASEPYILASGLFIKHTDLEAYVQERELKAFEAAREMHIVLLWQEIKSEDCVLIGQEIESEDYTYKTFEDFKKENHE